MPAIERLLSAQPALPVDDVERDGVILRLATQIVKGVGGCQILVEGVDALYERAKTAGGEMLHEITDEPWGTRDFTVLDPDGNAVTFAEVVSS